MNRSAFEPEALAQLIRQIALVRKMQRSGFIGEKDE